MTKDRGRRDRKRRTPFHPLEYMTPGGPWVIGGVYLSVEGATKAMRKMSRLSNPRYLWRVL